MVTLRKHSLENDPSVEAVTFENRLVRATILPGKGGQIVSLFDKRAGVEIIPEGASAKFGGEWEKSTSTYQMREPGGEDDPAAVSIFGLNSDNGLASIWLVLSLAENSPWLTADVRLHNRSLQPAYVHALLDWPGPGIAYGSVDEVVVNEWERRVGAIVRADARGPQLSAEHEVDAMDACPATLLGGRSLERTIAIAPIAGLEAITGAGRGWAAELRSDSLEICTEVDLGEVELHVNTKSGESMVAQVQLTAAASSVVSLTGLPPIAKAALVKDGQNLGWIYPDEIKHVAVRAVVVSATADIWVDGYKEAEIQLVGKLIEWESCFAAPSKLPSGFPGVEHLWHTVRAIEAARKEDWATADEAIDDALVTSGDDVLLWWAKAAVARHAGKDDDNSLPNAHYLSPMEPMLRVEAFLQQDQAQSAEANPLLAPIAANLLVARDCLGRLAMWGMWTDFARVADDILRAADDAVVRYLLAWSLARNTRMLATAAEHMAAAAKLVSESVYPLSGLEHTALRELAVHFPEDESLKSLSF